MIRLILIRHGNTFEKDQIPRQIGARSDLPLTEFGKAQAAQMGKYLISKNITPKAIFAGSLKRQTESAQIIASAFGLPFQSSVALTEIDYGDWEGLSMAQIEEKWPQEYLEWTQHSKWQEKIFQGSDEEHFLRIYHWVKNLLKDLDNETIVAVTSNGLLRLLRNEKVKTGHFCEVHLFPNELTICSWNQSTSLDPFRN